MSPMPSVPVGLLRASTRAASRWTFDPALPIPTQRRRMAAALRLLRTPKGIEVTQRPAGGVPAERLAPRGAPTDGALLYLHGGGYVVGSSRTHRALAGEIAVRMGLRAVVLDYRLAPEHPHPAALDDALAGYRGLLAEGLAPERVVVAGDSAGAGLTLALALALRDAGEPLPGALGLICPWLDVALDIARERPPAAGDPVLSPEILHTWARAYTGGADAAMPGISPGRADLSGLPPLVVQTASQDLLGPDGDGLAARARAAGIPVEHERFEGLWHDFHTTAGMLPAADRALDDLAAGLRRHLAPVSAGPRVAVIGAGMSGLCMGAKLRHHGLHDFTIHEKAGEVGGTWRENRYPGLTCDVPSRFYSYSFAPNPGWSHAFAPGGEIQEYFKDFADDLGLRSHIRFGSEVTSAEWHDGRWHLRTRDGNEDEADVLVCATGVLHHPQTPEIPGLDSFAGDVFHSARWDESARLDGRRVALVGTGSTGAQIVTAIAGGPSRLMVFQRTAQWILPVANRPYSALIRGALTRIPRLNRLAYRSYQAVLEAILGVAVIRDGWQRRAIAALCRANLRFAVRDSELRRRLTPDYEPMCKRLIMSAGFYPAMQKRCVELVTEGIDHVEPDAIVTRDGVRHAADVLVLATGFDPHAYMRPMGITGEDGVTLDEAWAQGPRAYRTVAMPGFPNLFMLMGPHSPVGNQSLVAVAEAQAHYALGWIEELRAGRVASVRPTAEATDAFNAEMRADLPGTVWATGCSSWYLGADGLPELWPWTPARHREMMREPVTGDFVVEPGPAAVAQPAESSPA